MIEKFCKHIRIQRPKMHQKQTFFFMGQNLCWPVLSLFITCVKFCKHIRIQSPKIHQKQTFFLLGPNLCWPVLSLFITCVYAVLTFFMQFHSSNNHYWPNQRTPNSRWFKFFWQINCLLHHDIHIEVDFTVSLSVRNGTLDTSGFYYFRNLLLESVASRSIISSSF